MSKDVATVQADADLEDAAKIMEQQQIRRLVVVEKGKLVGVLSHGTSCGLHALRGREIKQLSG